MLLSVGGLWLVFVNGSVAYEKLMNALTGGAVCLLTVGMGVYMIR